MPSSKVKRLTLPHRKTPCNGGDFAAFYKYRSFSLDGSNGLPDRGFLRAKAVSTP